MGQVYFTGVPEPEKVNDGFFGASRLFGIWPAIFPPNKTPVTVDVLESGLILAVVILAFCFYVVLPGVRGSERLYVFIRVTVSLFLGACIILCNWGQEWEVAHIHSETQYKAFTVEPIKADIGIKIGLRNVNITLKGTPVNQLNETINYNERFWWSFPWQQGRIGFGPFAGQFNQEFRAAQYKGLPYPILWIAEYFTLDGEGIRWGRNYRTAGWYAHIVTWTAFPCWLIANIFYFMNLRYGGYMTILTGFLMLIGNACWGGIRNFIDLKIPFEEDVLATTFGWSFWLNLIAGFLCIIIGAVVLVLDYFVPDALANFFGVDVLKDYEESYPETAEEPAGHQSASANGKDAEQPRQRPATVIHFKKRGPSVKKQARRPVAPPRLVSPPIEEDFELYENAEAARKDEQLTEPLLVLRGNRVLEADDVHVET